MAESVVVPAEVRAGTYRCAKCTNRVSVLSTTRIAPCPVCGSNEWQHVGEVG